MRKRVNVEKLLKSIGEEIEVDDWILSLIYASPRKSMKSEIHVQKALFLASRYIEDLEKKVEFQAYRFGPYSEDAKDWLEALEASSYVKKQDSEIILSTKGLERAKDVWRRLSSEHKRILENIASFVNKLDAYELMLYVYAEYGYSERSDIAEELMKKRLDLALSMLRKGAVSASLAAKLANMPLTDFLKYAKSRGVYPYTAEVEDLDRAGEL